MQVTLSQPNSDLSAEPVTIDAGATTALVRLHVATETRSRDPLLKLRACGFLRPDTPLVSEASVNITWP
jgi:hypothetical protein